MSLTTTSTATTTQTLSHLTTPFTPPPSCLAPTYTVGDVDSITDAGGGYILKGWSPECYPPGAPSTVYGVFPEYVSDECIAEYTSRSGMVLGSTTYVFCCPSATQWNDRPCERYQPSLLIPVTIINSTRTYTTAIASLHWPVVTMIYRDASAPYYGITQATFGQVYSPLQMGSVAETYALTTTNSAGMTVTESAGGSASTGTDAGGSVVTVTVAASGTGLNSVTGELRGLSTGAQAGIGVGVGVGGLLLIGAIVFWVLRRRRRRKMMGGSQADGEFEKSELPGESRKVPEMGVDEAVHEADHANGMPSEADRANVRAELDTGWRGWEADGAESRSAGAEVASR